MSSIPFSLCVDSTGTALGGDQVGLFITPPDDTRMLIDYIYISIIASSVADQETMANVGLGYPASTPAGGTTVTPILTITDPDINESITLDNMSSNSGSIILTDKIAISYLRLDGEEYIYFTLADEDRIIIEPEQNFGIQIAVPGAEQYYYCINIEGEI